MGKKRLLKLTEQGSPQIPKAKDSPELDKEISLTLLIEMKTSDYIYLITQNLHISVLNLCIHLFIIKIDRHLIVYTNYLN